MANISMIDHPDSLILNNANIKTVCLCTLKTYIIPSIMSSSIIDGIIPDFIINNDGIFQISTNNKIDDRILYIAICPSMQEIFLPSNWVSQGLGRKNSEYVVARLHKELTRRGYLNIFDYSTEYTTETYNAIKSFQADNNLNVTGVCDLQTLKKFAEEDLSFMKFDKSDNKYFLGVYDTAVRLVSNIIKKIGGDQRNIISLSSDSHITNSLYINVDLWFGHFFLSTRTFKADVNLQMINRYIPRSRQSLTYEEAIKSLEQLNIIDNSDDWLNTGYIISNIGKLLQDIAEYMCPYHSNPIITLYANNLLADPPYWFNKLYTEDDVKELVINFAQNK